MKYTHYRLTAIASITLCALFLSACGKRMLNVDEATDQNILLRGNGAEPESIDPHLATGAPDGQIICSLIEGLIAYHKTDDNIPEPGLAEKWESSDNSRIWRFHMRENAKWSNGEPVQANDFIYSYNRVLSASLASEYAPLLYVMKNAKEFHSGVISDFTKVGVKAIDQRTIEFTLTGPTPHFANMLKHATWFPVHKDTIENHGGMTNRVSSWTRAGNYVGTGPFILEEWVPNQIIKVKKNPHYWDADNVELEAIYFFPISNIHTENRSFLNGQLHITNELPFEAIDDFKDQPIYRNDPFMSVYYYMINTTKPPLNDIRVRQALSLAIDRKSITEDITRRGETPATGYTPPGFENYESPNVLKYNPREAKTLLAEAGFPNGEGFPMQQILFNNHAGHQAIAEAIQQMWKENLNIDVELYNQEWKVYLETRNRMDYSIARAGWSGDYMDPDTFLHIWKTEENDSLNDTGWSNTLFDGHLEAANQSDALEERYKHLVEAETILLNELPNIPIYWYTRPFLIDTRVRGWEPKLLDNRNFKYLSFEK